MGGGLDLARELVGAGKRVFLDMKLLDIENTVERATRNAAATGATFLTVHAQDAKTLRAALAGKAGTEPRDPRRHRADQPGRRRHPPAGHRRTPADLVARRAALARDAGCDGVVASGLEAARVRAVVGPQHGDRDARHPAARRCRRRPGARRRARRRRSPPAPTISSSAARSLRPPIRAAAAELFVRQIEEGLGNAHAGPAG